MPIQGPSISVNQNTTRDQLKTFLDGQAGDKRLLGKKDATTGATILYFSDHKAGLLDRISGRAAERRSNAREAVMTVFGNYNRELSGKGLTKESGHVRDMLFKSVSERMHAQDTSALRTGAVRSALHDAGLVGNALPKANPRTVPQAPQRSGPTVLDSGLTPQDLKALGTSIGTVQATDDDGHCSAALLQIADTLGDTIANNFSQANTGTLARENFALSDGTVLREQLAKVLATVVPEGTLTPENLEAFATRAFDRAAAKVSPDKIVDGQTKTILANKTGAETIELPLISVGTKTYEPVRFLGQGGFANVYQYKSTTDGEVIAFKVPIKQDHGSRKGIDESINEFAGEVRAHRDAQGANGHENVVGLKGAVRLPDGRIGMALELATGGDVHDMGDILKGAIGTGPGKITQQQADILRLTLVKDMAKGLQHVRGNNQIHLDFKTPNVMIGGDGRAKVADFGTTRSGPDLRALDMPKIDNPRYQAPELLYAKEAISGSRQQVKTVINKGEKLIQDSLKDVFPGAKPNQLKTIAQTIMRPRAERLRSDAETTNAQIRVTNSADTWALGMATANLFLGQFNPGGRGAQFNSEIQDDLVTFGSNPNNVALAPRQDDGSLAPGSLAGETHSASVTALINRMMHPDPGSRPTLTDILSSDALNTQGIGGDQAHALIAALASGDPVAIDLAKANLANSMA